MAYKFEAEVSLAKLSKALETTKKNAVATDQLLAAMGNYPALMKLAEQFIAIDQNIKEARTQIGTMKSELAERFSSGYMSTLEGSIDSLSTSAKTMSDIFENALKIDINKADAPKQLEALAKQLNAAMQSFGLDGAIDLKLFNTKDVKSQFNEIFGFIGQLNDKFNVSIGNVDASKLSKGFKGTGDGAKKASADIQKMVSMLKELNELTIKRDMWEGDANHVTKYEEASAAVQKLKQEFIELFHITDANLLSDLDYLGLEDDDEELKNVITRFKEYVNAQSKARQESSKSSSGIKQVGDNAGQLDKKLDGVEDSSKSAFTQIVEGADGAKKSVQDLDKSVQQVMYHLGNLLVQGGKQDTFGEMPFNLTGAVDGDEKYEKYGFGVLGGGLFGVTDPSTIDHNPRKNSFIQSIDLSKYNMYMANTEERAMALIDFLSKLQKFSMKSAEPNYTGFDSYLQGVDINALYAQFQTIFEHSDLTKEKFQAFINEMVDMLKQAGLAFDADADSLDFTNISNELESSDNISTRFMKMLGYDGVSVGTTSFDGFGQGNVLFDFKQEDIVGVFDSVKAAIKDYENISKQIDGSEWVGSREQLQEYLNNIEAVIARIQQYKSAGTLKDTSEVDATLTKLDQIKQNINNILSGKTSGEQSVFKRITGDASELDKAEEKLKSFLSLANQISENVLIEEKSDVELGKYEQKLESARQELLEFGNQHKLTAQQIEQMETAYEYAMDRIDQGKESHEESYKSLVHEVDLARDDYAEASYHLDKEKEKNRLLEERKALLEQEAAERERILQATKAEKAALEEELSNERYLSNELGDRVFGAEFAADREKERADALEKELALKKQIASTEENGLFDQQDVQLSIFDGIAESVQRAEASAEELKDTVKQISNIDGQASLFDEGYANEIQKANEGLREQKELQEKINAEQSTNAGKGQKVSDTAIETANAAEKQAASITEATNANEKLGDSAVETANKIGKEFSSAKEAAEAMERLAAAKKEAMEANKKLGDEAVNTAGDIDKETDAAKKFEDTTGSGAGKQKDSKKKYSKTTRVPYKQSTLISAEGRYQNLQRLSQPYVDNGSNVVTEQLNKYRQSLDLLAEKQKEINALNDLSSADAKQKMADFDALSKECNEYAKDLEKVINASKKFQSSRQNATSGSFGFDSAEGRQSALANYVKNTYGSNIKHIQGFNDELTELNFTIKGSDGYLQKMTAAFDQTGTVIATTSQKTSKANTVLGSALGELQKKWRSLLAYTTARLGVDDAIRQVRQGIQYIREIDVALTDLKKVTEGTDETYAKFLDNMSHTAGVVGSTISELTTMAAEWARLGYSIEDSAKLAESTAILLNVSEFSDATQASEALISTMQAFQYTADESQHVVDILNEVGKLIARR